MTMGADNNRLTDMQLKPMMRVAMNLWGGNNTVDELREYMMRLLMEVFALRVECGRPVSWRGDADGVPDQRAPHLTAEQAQARAAYDRQLTELVDWFMVLPDEGQHDIREAILACSVPLRKIATLGYGAITDTIISRRQGEVTE
jgi:hypothetical protein